MLSIRVLELFEIRVGRTILGKKNEKKVNLGIRWLKNFYHILEGQH